MSTTGDGLAVVLAAAGSSRRLGFDKLFTPVLGKTIFQTCLERIMASPRVQQIVIVSGPDNEPTIARLLPPEAQRSIPIQIVPGGAERQDSVRAGLAAVDPALGYVMIQDAARPFVTPELIEKVFAAAKAHGAAVCGQPSIDTLKHVTEADAADGTRAVVQTLDRALIWGVQTPQIFSRQLLLDAYAAVAAAGQQVTDDTAAVEAFGKPVVIVPNNDLNLKVTRKTDWEIAVRSLFPVSEDVAMAGELRKLIHDFCNQMTSVLGFTYLIDADCPADSPMKPSIESLNESVQKCHQITLTLQKFARETHSRRTAIQQGMENPVAEAKEAKSSLSGILGGTRLIG